MMSAFATLIETAMPRATLSLPVLGWLEVARQRRALARLSDRALADIGLDPAEARAEAARPFWDLPRHR